MMDSAACGVWESPRGVPAKRQRSSRPTGAQTWRQALTGRRQITVRLNFMPSSCGLIGMQHMPSNCIRLHIYSGHSTASLPLHPGRKISIVCVAAHFMLDFPHLFSDLQHLTAAIAVKCAHLYLPSMIEKSSFFFSFVLRGFQRAEKLTFVEGF